MVMPSRAFFVSGGGRFKDFRPFKKNASKTDNHS